MNWKEFKSLVKAMRRESNRLTSLSPTRIWCVFDLFITNSKIYQIYPFSVNLTTGRIYVARNIVSGKLEVDINLKKLIQDKEKRNEEKV